jgi:hypothetical protein
VIAKWEIYGIAVAALVVAMFGAYFYGHHVGYMDEKAEYDKFVAKVEAQGEIAKQAAAKKEADDKQAKKDADDANRTTIAALTLTIDRMRAQRPAGGNVPAAPAGSKRPDLICFERAAYQSAYGGLVKEVRGLADEGTKSTVDLDTAKSWSQKK